MIRTNYLVFLFDLQSNLRNAADLTEHVEGGYMSLFSGVSIHCEDRAHEYLAAMDAFAEKIPKRCFLY